ncbi:hypothetical protein J6590_087610 [Homalodisca vitripennis]|nr:hypothetical protein J6590_087610 [Homalodisca vitripennis]
MPARWVARKPLATELAASAVADDIPWLPRLIRAYLGVNSLFEVFTVEGLQRKLECGGLKGICECKDACTLVPRRKDGIAGLLRDSIHQKNNH